MSLFHPSPDASGEDTPSERETDSDPSTEEVLDGLLRRIGDLEERVAAYQQKAEINGERHDSAEGLRKAAEAGRQDEERFRDREEAQRVRAEVDRQAAEEARRVAEEARQIAEQARNGVADLREAARDHVWQLPKTDAN